MANSDYFLALGVKAEKVELQFPVGRIVECPMNGSHPFLISCPSSLGSGEPYRYMASSCRGFSESVLCLWEGEHKSCRLHSSLAHDGNLKDEDVMVAHHFSRVSSTLVRSKGHF